MNTEQLIEFAKWMEAECKKLSVGESFSISKEWIDLATLKNFRWEFNRRRLNFKIAITQEVENFVVLAIPKECAVSMFEKVKKEDEIINHEEECIDRIKKSIVKYFSNKDSVNYNYISKYVDTNELKKKETIPYNFIAMDVISYVCFKYGAEKAGMNKRSYLRHLLEKLIAEKVLLLVDKEDATMEFETSAELYTCLDDELRNGENKV